MRFLSPAACSFFLLFLAGDLLALEKAQLPFGLSWGQTEEAIGRSLSGAGLRITEKRQSGSESDEWKVEGLPQEGLQSALFNFREGNLAGVELQYAQESWEYGTYDEFMHRVRRSLDDRYGAGKQLARRQDPGAKINQTVVGYSWKTEDGAIELVYFAAQDQQHAFRMISLHYRSKDAEPTSNSPTAPTLPASAHASPTLASTEPGNEPLPQR